MQRTERTSSVIRQSTQKDAYKHWCIYKKQQQSKQANIKQENMKTKLKTNHLVNETDWHD